MPVTFQWKSSFSSGNLRERRSKDFWCKKIKDKVFRVEESAAKWLSMPLGNEREPNLRASRSNPAPIQFVRDWRRVKKWWSACNYDINLSVTRTRPDAKTTRRGCIWKLGYFPRVQCRRTPSGCIRYVYAREPNKHWHACAMINRWIKGLN